MTLRLFDGARTDANSGVKGVYSDGNRAREEP